MENYNHNRQCLLTNSIEKVCSWPIFAPEDSQFVVFTATSTAIAPGQSGRIEVEVPKRDLAEFNERAGKWVLVEGICMFEIKVLRI